MAPYVLAHLSDPHLATMPRPRKRDLAGKRLIGYLNWRRGRRDIHTLPTLDAIVRDLKAQAPDHIAVTGDLVNISLANEFPPARDWLASLGDPRDVTLVPGNHDAYVRRTVGFSRLHWTDFMTDDDDTGAEPEHFPFVRRRGPLVIIGLSSAIPSAPLMATGAIGSLQLKRFNEDLERYRDGDLFRVVLIHHPPRRGKVAFHKRLRDSRAVRAVIARHGADLVLHGHDHIHSVEMLDGPNGQKVPLVGVPSASAGPHTSHGEPAGYNLYEIEGSKGAWRCEVITRGFKPESTSIDTIARRLLSA